MVKRCVKTYKFNNLKNWVFLYLLVFLFTMSSNVNIVHGIEVKKTVLLLNSYNKGYTWGDDITTGIINKITKENGNVDIIVEYLDYKNFPYEENLNYKYNSIKYKYANKKIDLLISTDNAATDFLLKHRNEIFNDAPLVFCGVSKDKAIGILNKNENIAGYVAEIKPDITILTALNINPNAKNLYIIHDNTETGNDSFDEVKKVALSIKGDFEIKSIYDLGIDTLDKDLPSIPKDSIVMMTAFARDKVGETIQIEKMAKLLSSKINEPIYQVYEITIGSGVIGGSLLSSKKYGEHTAEIALNILKGDNVSNIGLIYEEDNLNEYDYKVLERFNIPLSKLPVDSNIMNKPFSFYETYKQLIFSLAIIFILLNLLILQLLRNISKRKKAELELNDSNNKLYDTYEKLALSDEELKFQYKQLQESKKIITKNEERYGLVFDASNDGIWEIDVEKNKRYFTDRWYEIFGFDKNYDINSIEKWIEIVHPDERDSVRKIIEEMYSGIRESFSNKYRIMIKSGEYRWIQAIGSGFKNSEGKVIRVTGAHSDIHEKKTQEEEIKKLAFFDPLTGLVNRSQIIKRFKLEIQKKDMLAAFIFIDLDNFKMLNDSFGHTIGDKFLVEIAKRLGSVIKETDIVSRFGGDEFAILLKDIKDKDAVVEYVEKIINIVKKTVLIKDNNISITTSIGVAMYPSDGESFEELLKNADTAMYKVKSKGKRRYKFYEKAMNVESYKKFIMENNLRCALENNEFLIHYQPDLMLSNGRITAFEALIRWNSKEYGMVPPEEFIGIAEEIGIIIPIGNWVMEQACSYMKSLHENGYEDLIIAVNVSVVQLVQEDFVKTVKEILEKTGLEPKLLGIEITESIFMDSIEDSIKKIQELRDMGINVAMDDFGKGYSSLTYLKRIPINILKIDKAFIDEIVESNENKDIVGAIITLSHKLNLHVIAEGVETKEQYDYLINNNCDSVQGYYISKPVPSNEVIPLLKIYNDN